MSSDPQVSPWACRFSSRVLSQALALKVGAYFCGVDRGRLKPAGNLKVALLKGEQTFTPCDGPLALADECCDVTGVFGVDLALYALQGVG